MTHENQQADIGYTGYEYRSVSVAQEYASLCLDSYPCFGWEADPNQGPDRRAPVSGGARRPKDSVTLYFRRVRSISSKAILNFFVAFTECSPALANLKFSPALIG